MRPSRSFQKTPHHPSTSILIGIMLAVIIISPVDAQALMGSTGSEKSGWKDRSSVTAIETARTLAGPNKPPFIWGESVQSFSVIEDSPLSLNLSASDPNPADDLTWNISIPAKNGDAAIVAAGLNPILTYTPAVDFFGKDTFSVQVKDPSGATDEVKIEVTVSPANDMPSSGSFSATGSEDTYLHFSQFAFSSIFSDPEGSAMESIQICPLPDHGTLFLGSNLVIENQDILSGLLDTLTYLPDTDWNGSDSFGWSGSDGSDYAVQPGNVSLTILPANDYPQITDDLDGPVIMDEDGSPQPFSLILHAGDVDLVDSFTWAIAEQPVSGIATIALGGFEAPVHYQPGADFVGSDIFIVRVEDGNGGSDTYNVEVLVKPVADPPLVTDFQLETIEETTVHFQEDEFLENYMDEADQNRMVAIQISALPSYGKLLLADKAITPHKDITTSALDDLDYVPEPNFTGTDTFAWVGYDGTAYSVIPATVSISISNVNDPPEFTDGRQVDAQMDEDSRPKPFTLELEAIDPDPGDSLEWSMLTPPIIGTAAVSASGTQASVAYTPPTNFSGKAEFSIQVADQDGEKDTILVSVDVLPANDLPVVTAISKAGNEDLPLAFTMDDLKAAFTDTDGDTLAKIKITNTPAHGSLTLAGNALKPGQEISADQLDQLAYQPSAGYSGMDYFGWTASDGQGYASPGSQVKIIVSPVEDTPVVSETGLQQIDLRATSLPQDHILTLHADDQDGDVLTWILAKSPDHGSLQAAGERYDLFIDYLPGEGYQGSDNFTIHLTDNHTPAVVIEVVVNGTQNNHAPKSMDSTILSIQGSDTIFQVNDFRFTDADEDSLHAIQISTLPDAGSLYLDQDSDSRIDDGELVVAGQIIQAESLPALKFKLSPGPTPTSPTTFEFMVSDGILFSQSTCIMVIAPACNPSTVYLPMIIQ